MVTARIEAAEMEQAVHKLLDKLEAWLQQQPEWVMFIGGADRQARRRVATEMAKYITTIPAQSDGPPVGRAQRRRIIREMERAERAWWK